MNVKRQPAVYVLASGRNGTLDVGVTSDLPSRVLQHKQGATAGFTAKYKVTLLAWYELHERMDAAIAREKQLKNWRRAWKVQLIEQRNPTWRDLWPEVREG